MQKREAIIVHACCASCAGAVLERLAANFEPTVYFYNPNIYPEGEYIKRLEDTRHLCSRMGIRLIEGDYRTLRWWKEIWNYKHLPERSERCWVCYRHRLKATARKAFELSIALFTTTLSISPHKSFERIASIGEEAGLLYARKFLSEDFKKHDGYKRSIELSREFGIDRQNYCGCLMSLEESNLRKADKQP